MYYLLIPPGYRQTPKISFRPSQSRKFRLTFGEFDPGDIKFQKDRLKSFYKILSRREMK
jgi:hypothetical protein